MEDLAKESLILETKNEQLEKEIIEQETCNRLLRDWRKRNCPCVETDDSEVSRAKLESLKHQLDIVKQFVPVTFEWVKSDVIQQDGMKITCKKSVEGRCGETIFQLDMTTTENLECVKDCQVTRLSIAASEFFTRDMQEHIEWLADSNDVQGFLRLVEGYSRWTEARTTTFQHFTSTYPKKVSLTKPDTLTIACKNCSMTVRWGLQVSGTSTVQPDMKLSIKLPAHVAQKYKDLFTSMDDRFDLMLQQLGIEKTINCLVALAT